MTWFHSTSPILLLGPAGAWACSFHGVDRECKDSKWTHFLKLRFRMSTLSLLPHSIGQTKTYDRIWGQEKGSISTWWEDDCKVSWKGHETGGMTKKEQWYNLYTDTTWLFTRQTVSLSFLVPTARLHCLASHCLPGWPSVCPGTVSRMTWFKKISSERTLLCYFYSLWFDTAKLESLKAKY